MHRPPPAPITASILSGSMRPRAIPGRWARCSARAPARGGRPRGRTRPTTAPRPKSRCSSRRRRARSPRAGKHRPRPGSRDAGVPPTAEARRPGTARPQQQSPGAEQARLGSEQADPRQRPGLHRPCGRELSAGGPGEVQPRVAAKQRMGETRGSDGWGTVLHLGKKDGRRVGDRGRRGSADGRFMRLSIQRGLAANDGTGGDGVPYSPEVA
jgi:hypothetical protein